MGPGSPHERHLVVLLLAWAAFVLAVYCPDVGRGFVKDDFTWIRTAQADMREPARVLLPREAGFYRPLVVSTFMADYRLHGWRPRDYGWTNFGLYVACAAVVALLAVALGLSEWAAVVAAFVWAVNPHGINMAVVWISGRTALLLTLCASAAAVAFVRRRFLVASALIALALASKEEAAALPFILLAWQWQLERRLTRASLVAALTPLALYLVFRSLTPAFTPLSAPAFYQFTFAPAHVVKNIVAYVDRSMTLAAVATCLAVALYRVGPSLDEAARRVLALGAIWWVGMLAITVWLPVRSSLYAVCPSVASAIACGLLLDRIRARSPRRKAWWGVEYVLAVAVVLAIPIYQLRNDPWVEGARVSQRVLETIRGDLSILPLEGTIRLDDETGTVSNFHNAFGDLASDAFDIALGRKWDVDVAIERGGCVNRPAPIAEYRLIRGRIVRVPPCDGSGS